MMLVDSKRALESEILRQSRAKESMVTIKDVAKQSGFSSTTVSIVLNDAPLARYIPKATKLRIHKAAKSLGYRPNLFARSLRSNRSHTVGVMVFALVLQGRGHRREAETPTPFAGAADFASRFVAEQWVTFPRFVLSGGWRSNLDAANRRRGARPR